MTLLELLEVDTTRLPRDSASAVKYCEGRWHEKGCPTEPEALAHFLDGALNFCGGVGYRYPKIFLLRLKQLQRGDWRPSGQSRPAGEVNPVSPGLTPTLPPLTGR